MSGELDFTINLAKEAGDLLLGYYDQAGLYATQKPDQTVVTEADLAADKLITGSIQHHFPDDAIISEESSHHITNRNTPTWIIDPLDGTSNFSLGISIWGVSIARVLDGFPSLGVLYFPLLNELYTCQRGSGAFLNHLPIHTRAPDSALPMSFFVCCSRTFRKFNVDIPYKPRIMGSGAYTYCLVARGAALLGFDAESKIWDLAAGWLLVEEAGGTITQFEGSPPFPILPDTDYADLNFPTFAAASPSVLAFGWNKIHRKSEAS
jgi:myo-inositol-1(or 4)-monophosphatase